VRVPDYTAPILAYRLWEWGADGLRSLNAVPWIAGQPLVARCGVRRHEPPGAECICGVYASKSLDSLRSMRLWDCGVRGEVLLWGTVVEHQEGWRGQFAYPKSLHLPPDSLPATLTETQSRLRSLTAYRCDISIAHDGASISLWDKESGLDAAGLDFLIGRGKEWYTVRQQERRIKPGDRMAILGHGIAVVERVNREDVHAVLRNRSVLRIWRRAIVWHERNMRWEASLRSCAESN